MTRTEPYRYVLVGCGNLQTLCEECHQEKTSRENSERAQTPSRGELSKSLFDYAAANTSE